MSKIKLVGAGAAAGFGFLVMLLYQLEGSETVAYQDIVGVWTICSGHTQGVKKGDTKTKEECRKLLSEEALVYWDGVDRMVTAPTRPREQVAFTSLAYNIGLNAFKGSTLLKRANEGNMPAACLEI